MLLPCRRVFFSFLVLSLVVATHDSLRAQNGPDDKARQVDAIFAGYANSYSPGCSVGVVRDSNYIYKRAFGMGSIELGVPLTPASVFYMGSVSKQFTAAAVVLAAEQGYLTLDDDLRKWIPSMPDYGHTITLRQMLHHTSGIRDVLGLMSLAGMHSEDIHPLPELLALVERQKHLNFLPGESYQYSNSNFMLLAEVVHRATGKPFSQFAQENIFAPLGMTHSRFYDDRTLILPGRVAAYAPRPEGGFQVNWSTNYDLVGGGGLMSSLDDLLLWDRNFYDNKLGKGTLLRELQTRGRLNNGKEISYALGLIVTKYRGLPVIEHDGANFGYRTVLLRFPEQKTSVICLCNLATANVDDKATRIADIYLAGQFPAATENTPAPAVSAGDLKQYAGLYRNAKEHYAVKVPVRDGGLGMFDMLLKPTAAGVFAMENGLQMCRAQATAGGGMRLACESQDGWSGVLDRIQPVQPTGAELADFAGDYFSEELNAIYQVRAVGGNLTLRIGSDDPVTLNPTVPDEFGAGVMLNFRRTVGKVTGFEFFAGAVQGIAFVRRVPNP
jgi:CubicO group peptidase (beta-lactamase class C family)